jgi:hypothetical protein
MALSYVVDTDLLVLGFPAAARHQREGMAAK